MNRTRTLHADPSTVLAVVPMLNEERHIAATLCQLLTGHPGLAQVKIVVADGGSTDGSRAIVSDIAARHPNVILIDNPDRLQAAGVNLAVETCAEPQHGILVRCDAHAIYPPAYILRVADSLVRQDAVALATVMDSVGDSRFQRVAAWAVDTKAGSGGSAHRGGDTSGYVEHGHHAGFLLDAWRAVGGYATDMATNEDAELDHRLGLAGGRIWLDADIRIGYKMRETLPGLARQYWRYGYGRAQNWQRHRMRLRLRQILPAILVVVVLLSLALSLISPLFLVVPILYAGALLGIAVVLAVRHRSLNAFLAAPILGAIHLCWGAGFLTRLVTGRNG